MITFLIQCTWSKYNINVRRKQFQFSKANASATQSNLSMMYCILHGYGKLHHHLSVLAFDNHNSYKMQQCHIPNIQQFWNDDPQKDEISAMCWFSMVVLEINKALVNFIATHFDVLSFMRGFWAIIICIIACKCVDVASSTVLPIASAVWASYYRCQVNWRV